jgi:hypothetical protein
MSISLGSSSKKTNTTQQQQTEPWAPTIPYLTSFLRDLDNGRSVLGPSQDQLDAFAELKRNAAAGNPFEGDITKLAKDHFSTASSRGQVDEAFKALQEQIGGYARGDFLDFDSNPYIQKMLAKVGDDVQSRINRMYAGAGRDLSGINQKAVGAGVTGAQLPILADLFNTERGRQMDAATTLYGAGKDAAVIGQDLDARSLATRATGVPMSQAAIDADNFGANAVLNLDQQLKQLPFDDMSLYANLLLPTAGLGGQSAGSGTSKSSGSSFGLGMNLLSDERAKEDIEEVGKTEDGQKIYRFRYKGDPTVHIGLLAQEVEKRAPGAVSEDSMGVKSVDYEQATAKAARLAKARRAS